MEYLELVERRVKSGQQKLTKMQRQTMQMMLSDMVSTVENRAWAESEVCDVLYGVTDAVAGMEAERLFRKGKRFEWKGVPRLKTAEDDDKEEEVIPEGWAKYENEQDGVWYEHPETGDTAWEYPGQAEYLERERLRLEAKEQLEGAVKLENDGKALLGKSWKSSETMLQLGDFMQSTTKATEMEAARVRVRTASIMLQEQEQQQQGEEENGEGEAKPPSGVKKISLPDDPSSSAAALDTTPAPSSASGRVGFRAKAKGGLASIASKAKKPPMVRMNTLAAARALMMKEDAALIEEEDEQVKDAKTMNAIGKLIGDSKGSKLSIEVFDADFGAKGDFLGVAKVPFAVLVDGNRGADDVVSLPLERAEPGTVNDAQGVENVTGTIEFCLTPLKLHEETDKIEQWTLRIMRAKGLAKADLLGKSDPFCVVKWGKQDSGTGTTKKVTLNPEWGGGEKDTFQVPAEDARLKDEEETTALRRTMKKTKALGDAMGQRGKIFGNMLKRGVLQVKMMVGMAAESKDKIVDEVAERLSFWEEETVRAEMERRYVRRAQRRRPFSSQPLSQVPVEGGPEAAGTGGNAAEGEGEAAAGRAGERPQGVPGGREQVPRAEERPSQVQVAQDAPDAVAALHARAGGGPELEKVQGGEVPAVRVRRGLRADRHRGRARRGCDAPRGRENQRGAPAPGAALRAQRGRHAEVEPRGFR